MCGEVKRHLSIVSTFGTHNLWKAVYKCDLLGMREAFCCWQDSELDKQYDSMWSKYLASDALGNVVVFTAA